MSEATMAEDKRSKKRRDGNSRKQNRVITDQRFSKVHSDPRFARIPAKKKRVKVDSRFSALFHDPAFRKTAKLDRWGRKVDTAQENREMERLYELNEKDDKLGVQGASFPSRAKLVGESSQSSMVDEGLQSGFDESQARLSSSPVGKKVQQQDLKGSTKRKRSEPLSGVLQSNEGRFRSFDGQLAVEASCEGISSEGKKEGLTPLEAKRRAMQVARMRGVLGVSSGEESDSADASLTDEEQDGSDVDLTSWGVGAWAGNPDESIEEGAPSRRFAAVDLDWDNLRAVDILHVMRSFLPNTGRIEKINVYVSDYGRERMAAEAIKGPAALGVFDKVQHKDKAARNRNQLTDELEASDESQEFNDDDDDDDGSDDVNVEQLRLYEKSKLRYHYAVVECDSIQAASHLVKELDGREFEKSHCVFDLRYVPDDMDFSGCLLRDSANEVPDGYEPPSFECNAMTKTKLKLSWDDDDPQRKKQIRRKFKQDDLLNEDFRVYLASESDQESDGDSPANDINSIRMQYTAAFGKLGESSNSESSSELDAGTQSGSGAGSASTSDLEEISDDELVQDLNIDATGQSAPTEAQSKCDRDVSSEASDGLESSQHSEDSKAGILEREPENEITFQMPSSGLQDKPFDVEKTKKKRKKMDLEEKSHPELDLLLLDDTSLRAARRGAGKLQKTEHAEKRRMTKKERIRISKLQKHLKKQGSDDEALENNEFKVDLTDKRFEKMFSSADYAIDPTHPDFKRSKGAEALLKEVVKAKNTSQEVSLEKNLSGAMSGDQSNPNPDLSNMVKRLKKKYPKNGRGVRM